ncbi:MAG: hypothetical protein JSS82_04710 [Bacteroidetes bacterium]|nr:hypothetical protein [Bacteroidota bacterium]
MMKAAFVTCCILIVIVTACRTYKKSTRLGLPGTWQEQAIVVDGRNNDWPSPYPFADTHTKFMYAVSNDMAALYVTMSTADPKTQLKILRTGMKLWIDTTGAHSQGIAIDYPLTRQKAQIPAEKINTTAKDKQERLRERARMALDSATQLSLYGFKNCNGVAEVMQENTCGIKVRIAINDSDNTMVWEASIPFKAIYGRQYLKRNDEGRPISICFAINSFELPEQIRNIEEKMRLASQNPNDPQMEGARAAARFAEVKDLFETTSTWKQFGLAYSGR